MSVIAAFTFLALVMTMFENPPEIVVILGTIGILFGLFVVSLSKYLRQSKHPIAQR